MKRQVSTTCPKTGRKLHPETHRRWPLLLLPITGLLAMIWFLMRVIPKPSRAAYPCQRVAVPLASGFVVWITGLVCSTLIYRKSRRLLHQSRYVLAGILAAVAVVIVWVSICATENNPASAAFSPSEPANSPTGTARGIYPGRVVWIRDANATSWDASAGNWWDDKNTDQKVVDAMVSVSIKALTGKSADSQAWDALFRYFNKTRGSGDAGYQKPEKIAIKINMNQDRGGREWRPDAGNPSPQVIYSLVNQLVKVVGVPGSAITIYDASRYIGDPIYNKIRGNPDPNFQAVTFVVAPNAANNGRIAAVHDSNNPLQSKAGTAYLPQCLTQAKYLINLALMRAHTLCGITLCAKNHFGTTYFPDGGWTPRPLHNTSSRNSAMGSYNCLVDLNGHKQTGGKTLLYMLDALYAARNQTSAVIKFASFDDDWCSSIFVSQDMVAIDSVGLDFLRNEQAVNPKVVDVVGTPDNYLHEAALANSPPSNTPYDPEGDSTAMESLGVHEHWNNPKDRKYSRNLGTGSGIELIALSPSAGRADALTGGSTSVVAASP